MATKYSLTRGERARLGEAFGVGQGNRKIRVTRDGEVHAYGSTDPYDRSEDRWMWMADNAGKELDRLDREDAARAAAEAEGDWLRAEQDQYWLGEQRAALGLTQAALAERLGLTANTIARIERGEMRLTRRTYEAVRLLRGA